MKSATKVSRQKRSNYVVNIMSYCIILYIKHCVGSTLQLHKNYSYNVSGINYIFYKSHQSNTLRISVNKNCLTRCQYNRRLKVKCKRELVDSKFSKA